MRKNILTYTCLVIALIISIPAFSVPPIPQITANGQSGSITVDQNANVNISLGLTQAPAKEADWWLAFTSPSLPNPFFYNLNGGWNENRWTPTYTGTLHDSDFLPPFSILNRQLPVGDYTVYFGVDLTPDKKLSNENLAVSSIDVHVSPGNPARAGKLKATQIVTGDFHVCALMENGQVKCWQNHNGDGSGYYINSPITWRPDEKIWRDEVRNIESTDLHAIDFATNLKVVQLTAGIWHTCARLENGQVKCWGYNKNGELGLGNTTERYEGDKYGSLPFVDLGTGRKAIKIVAANHSTCVLLDNGKVKCWGTINEKMAGLGYTKRHGDQANEMGDYLPEVSMGTDIAVDLFGGGSDEGGSLNTRSNFCVKTVKSVLKCWGYNDYARLKPINVNLNWDYGDDESFDQLPGLNIDTSILVKDFNGSTILTADGNIMKYDSDLENWKLINLGSGVKVISMPDRGGSEPKTSIGTLSDNFDCAVLGTGRLKCWGSNRYGELGLGNVASVASPTEMGDALPFVEVGSGQMVKSVALAERGGFTCAILDDGGVKCWGQLPNSYINNRNPLGDEPNEMGDNLPYVELGNN